MTDTASETTRLSKSETVYRELRERILSGRYVAGYRLVFDQLAREHAVSAVPVREAVRRLEAEGLVTFTPNVGAEVSGINTGDYADTMQVLALLEGAATSLSAAHLGADRLSEATALNDEMRALRGENFDPVRFTELNERFHQTMCSACPNVHLLDVLRKQWQRMSLIRRSTFPFIPARTTSSVAEHDEILRLVRENAPVADIEQATRAHKLRTVAEYLAVSPESTRI